MNGIERSGRWLGFVAVVAALASTAAAQELRARQVVAPPSDILKGVVRLPDPASVAISSSCSMTPLEFVPFGDRWAATAELAVESDRGWTLLVASPAAATWRVLGAPRGAGLRVLDESFAVGRRIGLAGDELAGFVLDRRELRSAPSGPWTVRIEADRAEDVADGWIFASASDELLVEAFATTSKLVRGERIGVAARASGREFGAVLDAALIVETRDERRVVAMRDDGLHEDGDAGDGWFGARLPDDLAGPLTARTEMRGVTSRGAPFVRHAQLAFTVLEPVLELTGAARATRTSASSWRVEIAATPLAAPRKLHVSAEVWGRIGGGDAPLCWLSRMSEPAPTAEGWSLELELDDAWLASARAQGPFELRAVRVQDPDTAGVLATRARVPLSSGELEEQMPRRASRATSAFSAPAVAPLNASGSPVGPFPPVQAQPILPALMLVHGYCSGGTPWPAADFTQPKVVFFDPDANRSHDQFAQLLAARAQTAQLTSFGVVAHSQGGAAALHLLTYYTSGLDFASGGRRIQSLATPYQGTPLASLGFFSCGVNDNMTPAGAATWLAGIPSWARAEVSYWTTSNSGSACNFFTGLLLTDPEDGTIEQFRGQLPGANSMGHTVGWCHTTGMSNPAGYTDASRNHAMNAAAAR